MIRELAEDAVPAAQCDQASIQHAIPASICADEVARLIFRRSGLLGPQIFRRFNGVIKMKGKLDIQLSSGMAAT